MISARRRPMPPAPTRKRPLTVDDALAEIKTKLGDPTSIPLMPQIRPSPVDLINLRRFYWLKDALAMTEDPAVAARLLGEILGRLPTLSLPATEALDPVKDAALANQAEINRRREVMARGAATALHICTVASVGQREAADMVTDALAHGYRYGRLSVGNGGVITRSAVLAWVRRSRDRQKYKLLADRTDELLRDLSKNNPAIECALAELTEAAELS